jgi:hypothetical protein
MAVYVIRNPVPTPEEMAEILGVSPERVAAIRKIMDTPVPRKKSTRSTAATRKPARKASSSRKSTRTAAKK